MAVLTAIFLLSFIEKDYSLHYHRALSNNPSTKICAYCWRRWFVRFGSYYLPKAVVMGMRLEMGFNM